MSPQPTAERERRSMPSPSCDPDPNHQGTAVPAAERGPFTHSIAKIRCSLGRRVSISPTQFRELLLSHHPDHPSFDNDIIRIRGRRICAGCLLAYPTALLVVLLLRPTGLESIFIALLLAAISLLRRLSANVPVQHAFRVLAGIALGFGIGGVFWAMETGNWIFFFVLAAGAGLYAIGRAWSLYGKLNACSTG